MNTTAVVPGLTAYILINRRTAPDNMTPGLVVAGEHIGPFDEPRRDDQHLGPGLDEPLDGDGVVALDDGDPVVLVATGDGGVGQDLHAGGRDICGEVGSQGPITVASPQ